MKIMNKKLMRFFRYFLIWFCVGFILSSFVTSCSSVNTGYQNMFGLKVEAYYSKKTGVVCFTETNDGKGGLQCLPAKDINTKQLNPGDWTVV